jgi:hypothetical protein
VRQFLFAIAIVLQAQSVKPDTQALAGTLNAIRGEPGPSKEQFRAIQQAFFEWIDVRLRNRESTDQLNRELREAEAFDQGFTVVRLTKVSPTSLDFWTKFGSTQHPTISSPCASALEARAATTKLSSFISAHLGGASDG